MTEEVCKGVLQWMRHALNVFDFLLSIIERRCMTVPRRFTIALRNKWLPEQIWCVVTDITCPWGGVAE